MIILACKRHPLYKAKRQPRCGCSACWLLWDLQVRDDVRVTNP